MDLSKLLGPKTVPPEKEGPPVSSGQLCRASRRQNGDCLCHPRVLCAVQPGLGNAKEDKYHSPGLGLPWPCRPVACKMKHATRSAGASGIWIFAHTPFLLSWKDPHFQEFNSLIKNADPLSLSPKSSSFHAGKGILYLLFFR